MTRVVIKMESSLSDRKQNIVTVILILLKAAGLCCGAREGNDTVM